MFVKNIRKKAFSLVEISVVIVIITLFMATIMASRVLIEATQLNKIHSDTANIQNLTDIFHNTFDCLAGDCPYKQLPENIRSQTPSGCFNLKNDYITPLSSPIITTGFNTGAIDQNAKRSCMFYEFIAFESQNSYLSANNISKKINSVLGVQSANAVAKILLSDNPVLQDIIATKIDSINSNITTNDIAIITNNATIATNQGTITANNTAIANNQATIASHNNIIANNQNNMANQRSYATNMANYSGGSCPTVTDNDMINIAASNPCAWQRMNILQCGNTNCQSYCNNLCYVKDFNTYVLPSYNNSKATVNTLTAQNATLNDQITTATNTINTLTTQNATLNTQIADATLLKATLNTQLEVSSEPNTYLAMSVNSATNPIVSSTLKSSMWDSITVSQTNKTYPYEASNLSKMLGKQLLISRNTSTNNINSTDIDGVPIKPENDKMAGFSANVSRKIDIKFDDGKPYTGNIIAGKNVADLTNIKGCTNISLTNFTDVTNHLDADYATGNSLVVGCVVGFIIRS